LAVYPRLSHSDKPSLVSGLDRYSDFRGCEGAKGASVAYGGADQEAEPLVGVCIFGALIALRLLESGLAAAPFSHIFTVEGLNPEPLGP
jgi:hypothetical protein